MGNFHCIPSSCAEVVYREYLSPSLRYRYPDQPWEYVEGANNYTLEEDCPVASFVVEFWYDTFNGNTFVSNRYYRVPGNFYGKPIRVREIEDGSPYYMHIYLYFFNALTNQNEYRRYLINTSPTSQYYVTDYNIIYDETVVCNCIFKAYKDDELLLTRGTTECPEVEELPCRLSEERKVIKIDKLAYLQRVEVRNQAISTVVLPPPINAPFIQVRDLPTECLNIYNTLTLSPPIPSDQIPIPGALNPFVFVEQICSPVGCPPPEYEVLCDCDCRSCPKGTCPVECTGQICCYDKLTGKAVESIPLAEYCEN